MKKLVLLFAAMVMCCAMWAEPITVRLKASSLPKGWGDVAIYFWGAENSGWPGEKLTAVDGWYTKTFKSTTTSISIIWNNNDNGKQTGNIENVTTSTCYEINGGSGTTHTVKVVDCQTPEVKYYLAGSMTDWQTNMVELTKAEDDSLYRVSVALEANSLYEYKLVRVEGSETTWYGLPSAGTMVYGNSTGWWIYKSTDVANQTNVGLQTTKAADYAFAFDVRDIANKAVVSVVIPKIVYTYDTVYSLVGNFTNWASGAVGMPHEVSNVQKDSVLEYKVIRELITYADLVEVGRDTTWLGQPNEGNEMTRDNNSWKLDGGNNVKLTADADGTYRFAFAAGDSTLTVTFPEKPVVVKAYYITGNEALVGAKAWDAKALKMTDSIHTFMGMAAGDYKMKITDGAWDPEGQSWGFANLDSTSSEGITGDKDGNICFTVETSNNVVVSIANGIVKVTGNFKKEPTGIDTLQVGGQKDGKIIVNDQLIIIRNGVWYNATGARVR